MGPVRVGHERYYRILDGREHATAELRDRIAADLKLTPEEISMKLPSGVQTVFAYRIASRVDDEQDIKPDKIQTPEEQLASAYGLLRDALAIDVLEAVKRRSQPSLKNL